MEDCKAIVKVTTYPGKVNMFQKHILPCFWELKLNEITAATVRQWQTKMLSSKKYKPTYLKSIHNQLSAAFNYACRFYGLRENSARSCGSMGKKKADKMDFWTLEEFQKLRGHRQQDNYQNHFQSAVLERDAVWRAAGAVPPGFGL